MRGLPCIRGTRVTVSAVLGQLATGASIDELLADYPYLEFEDVLAADEEAIRLYVGYPTCDGTPEVCVFDSATQLR